MKGKLSFIHKAQKEQYGESDLEEKNRLKNILRYYFGISMLMNVENSDAVFIKKTNGTIYFEQPEGTKQEILKNYWVHFPDGFVKNSLQRRPILVEIDGKSHWQNSNAVKKTNERNAHYEVSNAFFIWFTDQAVKEKPDAYLIENISRQIQQKVIK